MQLCGIDEAGRGPLAGPLTIAGVILNNPIEGLNDSKKLTEKKRESLYELICENSIYHIARFDAAQIDELGLSQCLATGLREIMSALGEADYLYDGNSKFGVSGLRTMVKADATVPEVSAASILAKVTRDREMIQLASLYPQYGFDGHKGYGCAAHIEAIRQYGYCEIHRKTFKLKAFQPSLF
ncbi:RNase HII [Sulfuricurvum kujiense DSM 16994]|uniref:Ribonuclease HII n=1 Tax=Sulfuricurvum kujiense (strain ATCC BAA-921 / DSM 16994 / JCM 11577 / YK-1) TaxID=709032 RepID=E4TXF6_SULKY|nr:ribonuclease HII [Sulfuricurvum kujiense]ADR32853.1 RNase HII [Sulfuricurvum kujiense DSM 16994]